MEPRLHLNGSTALPRQVHVPSHEPKRRRVMRQTIRPASAGANRSVLAAFIFAVCFTIVAARLVVMGVGAPGVAIAHGAGVADQQIHRRDIVDRHGRILATDLVVASLFADARKVIDPAQAAAKLVTVLPELDAEQIEARLASRRAFVWLKRDLTPKQKYAVHSLGIAGVDFVDEHRRVYPNGRDAAHVLGYVNVDNDGLAGIERGLNSMITDKSAAEPVVLSLDLGVQHAVQEVLGEAMTTFSAVGAAGLVMDAKTGEVLALASLPDFDPNVPGEISADAQFNRATLGVYELGSIFKTFTTAMALDSGRVGLDDTYDATKPFKIGGFTIRDYHPENRWLSVPEIFMHSSNIGTGRMALDMGREAQVDFLGRLGLLERASFELPEVGSPLTPAPWRDVNTVTVSYGHGIAVTPLQAAAAGATVVNGGFRVEPTLLKRSGLERAGREAPRARVLSAKTSETMRGLLRLVVAQGTGGKADVAGYAVGGKTGSAEKPSGKGYDRRALMTSFLATFPAQSPEYVVLIVLDEPKGTAETYNFRTAGWNAAPTAGKIIERIAPMLGVAPSFEEYQDGQEPMLVAFQR